MNKPRFESADELFMHSLGTWGTPESYLLRENDPLPDSENRWWMLHLWEIDVFAIDITMFPRLIEAYSWYSGAIAESAHNDYHDFREAEQERWQQHVVTKDGEIVFDHVSCMRFMHEAAGLPLRQCEALLQKMAATELRGPLLRFRDEPPSEI